MHLARKHWETVGESERTPLSGGAALAQDEIDHLTRYYQEHKARRGGTRPIQEPVIRAITQRYIRSIVSNAMSEWLVHLAAWVAAITVAALMLAVLAADMGVQL
jgi:hypothetical protein